MIVLYTAILGALSLLCSPHAGAGDTGQREWAKHLMVAETDLESGSQFYPLAFCELSNRKSAVLVQQYIEVRLVELRRCG